MSQPAPAPAAAKSRGGWLKALLLGALGLGGGAAGTYATAVFDKIAKPARPVANFAVSTDGLTVTCQNHATGEAGWWDFGDGTPLEPFAPDGKPVTHAYAKPGSYAVKLTVRNFVADENERSVPVEVSAGGKDAPAPPRVNGFAVQPVSPVSVAPATFRVTAEVTNAEHCVWDFGDGRLEITAGGKIDRMVTFDQAGTFPVQLVAHNGKAAAKQAAGVKVEPPKAGSTMVVLKVTDTGTRGDRTVFTESVAVPAPRDKAATGFSKVIAARPGWTIADAAPGNAPGVKNLKLQIAPDKRSVTLTGESAADLKAGKGTGSDAIVPVKLTEERTFPTAPTTTLVTGTLVSVPGYNMRADLPLPPVPVGLAGHTREYQIELREIGSDGKGRTLVQAPPGGKGGLTLPWSWSPAPAGSGGALVYTAKIEGDRVVVAAGWLFN